MNNTKRKVRPLTYWYWYISSVKLNCLYLDRWHIFCNTLCMVRRWCSLWLRLVWPSSQTYRYSPEEIRENATKPRPFKRFANTNRNTNCYMKKRKLESRRTEPKKKGSTFPRVTLFSLLLFPSDTVTRKCIATGIHRRFSPTVCLREVDRGISGSITENLVTPNVWPDIYSRSLQRTIQPCYRRTNDNSLILPAFDNTSSALIQTFVVADRFSLRPRKLMNKLLRGGSEQRHGEFRSPLTSFILGHDQSFFENWRCVTWTTLW